MNYAKIRKMDCSNGYGIRTTLFVSGCTHRCKGCFNKEAQDFNYGNEFTKEVEDEFISYIKNPNVIGVNILGGEPLQQDNQTMLRIVKRIKEETGKHIFCWTGYKFEDLHNIDGKMEILKYIDVLVDGRFEEDKRDLMLKYRGSSNQRVIDVQASLQENRVVLYNIDEV